MSYKHITTLQGMTLDEIKEFSKNDTKHYFRVKKYNINPICQLCGKPFDSIKQATLDHIIPRSEGGRTREHNLRLAHMKCNSRRNSEPEDYPSWLQRLAYTPMVKNTPRTN